MHSVNNVVAILGAGGFAREMYWHIKDAHPATTIVFVDDLTETTEVVMAGRIIPVVKNWKFDALYVEGRDRAPVACTEFVIGVGSPQARKTLVQRALACGLRPAPTVIHPRALVQGQDCEIGVGGVIAPGCVITTHVQVGDYVLLGVNVAVGHDTVIGDYVTCNPGSQVSGNVVLGEGVLLGTGAAVREKIVVAAGVLIGAQACVVKDINEPNITVVGVPARKLG
jgi:sugar O-acyltransferase (sialic acid O-acetyltransferase NeuD family)